MVAIAVRPIRNELVPARDRQALFDFRPVFRNRSAMAYALAYCVHTLEMNALRGWGVAFLAYVAASTGTTAGLLSPTVVATGLALIGTAASVAGNEAAIRFGRRRLIHAALVGSILIAGALAFKGTEDRTPSPSFCSPSTGRSYGSIRLPSPPAQRGRRSRRGAAPPSPFTMLGYAGGFVGPLAIGWVLDLSGGMSAGGSAAAFSLVAFLVLLALIAFKLMRPRELEGDRGGVRRAALHQEWL